MTLKPEPTGNEREELLRYLQFLRDCHRHNVIPKNWVYDGPCDFLIREGKWYTPPKQATTWIHSEVKACFRNAAMYVCSHPEKRLHYVEGYAVHLIPVHHGWVADDDNNVIEVTWDTPGICYLGVEFKPMQVRHGSVLFNENAPTKIYRQLYKRPGDKQ